MTTHATALQPVAARFPEPRSLFVFPAAPGPGAFKEHETMSISDVTGFLAMLSDQKARLAKTMENGDRAGVLELLSQFGPSFEAGYAQAQPSEALIAKAPELPRLWREFHQAYDALLDVGYWEGARKEVREWSPEYQTARSEVLERERDALAELQATLQALDPKNDPFIDLPKLPQKLLRALSGNGQVNRDAVLGKVYPKRRCCKSTLESLSKLIQRTNNGLMDREIGLEVKAKGSVLWLADINTCKPRNPSGQK